MAAEPNYDRASELKAFDETKTGVKGLVDGGITHVPRIFIHPQNHYSDKKPPPGNSHPKFPVIDLKNSHEDPISHNKVVGEVLEASATWGFFQVINHGIPDSVLEEMLNGTRRFYEQDAAERKKWYTRDFGSRVVYNSNFDLYSALSANWRDTVYCQMAPHSPDPHQLPPVCR